MSFKSTIIINGCTISTIIAAIKVIIICQFIAWSHAPTAN